MTDNPVDILLLLSRPAPAPDRTAALAPWVTRADAVMAQLADARAYRDLVEKIAMVDMRAILPKVTADAYPVVGRLYHAGVALRGHLDSDFRDLRDSVRAARAALSADAARFTAAMQILKRDVERDQQTILHMATLTRVVESAHATLSATPFVSETFVVAKPLHEQFNNQPAPTSAA